jgi:hypothetical protein
MNCEIDCYGWEIVTRLVCNIGGLRHKLLEIGKECVEKVLEVTSHHLNSGEGLQRVYL